MVLAMILVLMLVVTLNRHQYTLQLRNVLNSRDRVMAYNEEQNSSLANILLWVVVLMGFSMALYAALVSTSPTASAVHFVVIALVAVLYIGLKWVLFKVLGRVFDLRKKAEVYASAYFIVLATSGLLSLLIATGAIYSVNIPPIVFAAVYALMAVAALVFILFKAIQIFYCGIASLFYIFLYLCSLEIMPAMLLLKVAAMV